MTEHWITKCRSFEDYEDLANLEDDLNKFFENRFIISSPIFYNEKKYSCMVYYKVQPTDVIEKQDNDQPRATDKQVKYLMGLGYKGEIRNLSIQEAKHLIQELKESKKNDKI